MTEIRAYLIKTEYRCTDLAKKDILREEYLSDYREVDPSGTDERRLQAANVSADGPALLEFLNKRTLDEARRKKIASLIRKLSDSSFDNRESAKNALVAEGSVAVPLLTRAQESTDPEVADRAKECLQQIGKSSSDTQLVAAVVRLLAQRQPEGAVKALLAYLPSAPDKSVAQEVRAALTSLAFRDGKPDPALVQARDDKNQTRRAAAVAILGHEKGRDERPTNVQKAATERAFVRGFKHPMKGVEYRDGKKAMEWEITEVQLFKRLDDSIFAKP